MILKHIKNMLNGLKDNSGVFIQDSTGDWASIDKIKVKDGNVYLTIKKEWKFTK